MSKVTYCGPLREYRVLNLGAGVQSTTLYLMFMRGEIQPQIDCAIFADTQEEPRWVYEHLAWLRQQGGPEILVRTVGKLGDDLLLGQNTTGGRFTAIPAFTAIREGEKSGITRRQCTHEYKVRVIERAIRYELLGLKSGEKAPIGTVTQFYGISLEEGGRAARLRRRLTEESGWRTFEFPLIDRFMTRADCLRWLEAYGLPHLVRKSSCVFCPFHRDYEWRELKENDPAGWVRAIEIDAALRKPGTVCNRKMNLPLYLHADCLPLDQVDIYNNANGAQYSLGFALECEGMCGV